MGAVLEMEAVRAYVDADQRDRDRGGTGEPSLLPIGPNDSLELVNGLAEEFFPEICPGASIARD